MHVGFVECPTRALGLDKSGNYGELFLGNCLRMDWFTCKPHVRVKFTPNDRCCNLVLDLPSFLRRLHMLSFVGKAVMCRGEFGFYPEEYEGCAFEASVCKILFTLPN